MEYHRQQNTDNSIEVCTIPCKHIDKKVERFKISVFYESNPCWIKGWHLMIEPQYRKDNKYVCDDYAGYCFSMIQDIAESEILKQKAISEAEITARYLIMKYGLGVII